MLIDLRDPIIVSVLFGKVVFLLSILILWRCKPRAVTKEGHKINWEKLAVLALIIAITSSLSAFLLLNKDVIEYHPEKKTTMKFGANY